MNPKTTPPRKKPNPAHPSVRSVNGRTADIRPPTATALDRLSANAGISMPTLKPILTMKAISNPPSHNYYGFERIHILQFNYDGKGSALVRWDNETDLNDLCHAELIEILLGDPGSGDRWYRPEAVVKKRQRSRASTAVRRLK